MYPIIIPGPVLLLALQRHCNPRLCHRHIGDDRPTVGLRTRCMRLVVIIEDNQADKPVHSPRTRSSRTIVRYACRQPSYRPLVDCMRILTRSVGCAIDSAIAPVVIAAAIRSNTLLLSTADDLPTTRHHQHRLTRTASAKKWPQSYGI